MKSSIALFLAALLSATGAHAWDDEGHMMVAAIAYDKLTPAVWAKVDALVKLNPKYNNWVAGLPAKGLGKTAFEIAATWPDQIKADSAYDNDGEIPKGPAASQNIGYADKLMHKYWHYYDTPFSTDGTALTGPKTPNAETQIAEFRKTLASAQAADDVKSYDLMWLAHLVGDVHQPLHATSRFTSDAPAGDEGGNKVTLKCKSCPKELHAYWDEALGTSKKPSDAAAAAKKLAAAPAAEAAIADEAKWIDESFKAAEKSVYAKPIGALSKGPYALTPAYEAAAKKLAAKRVALAGARLANLLNTALK